MSLFNTYVAQFYTPKGEPIGSKKYNPHDQSFKFKNGRYIIDMSNPSMWEWNVFPFPLGWLWRKCRTDYNINRSHPIVKSTSGIPTDGKGHPVISPLDFNTIFESKHAKDLNTPRFNWDWKVILIAVLGLAVIIYLLTGHKVA